MKKTKRKINKSRSKKVKAKGSITKNMSFSEIIEKFPQSVEILMEKGMHCIGCSMASYETLEQGALMHGLNPDKLIEEINRKLKKK